MGYERKLEKATRNINTLEFDVIQANPLLVVVIGIAHAIDCMFFGIKVFNSDHLYSRVPP